MPYPQTHSTLITYALAGPSEKAYHVERFVVEITMGIMEIQTSLVAYLRTHFIRMNNAPAVTLCTILPLLATIKCWYVAAQHVDPGQSLRSLFVHFQHIDCHSTLTLAWCRYN